MSKKSNSPEVILPARMTLRPEALKDLEIAIFDFPYQEAFESFISKVSETRKHRTNPPYRLLNSAIVACAPTVTHGFEKSRKDRRMMAVGKPIYGESGQIVGSDSQYPSEEVIAQVIRAWTYQWGQSNALKRLIVNELEDAWQQLAAAIEQPPDTQWRRISSQKLLRDLYIEKGLAFDAIPSLLATLLHGKEMHIGESMISVKWRRAQDGKNRFCAISQPIPTAFIKESDFKDKTSKAKQVDDFFVYKLVFRVQTQTGRSEPWIYVFLHCQRYAPSPLTGNKRGNDITILTGLNVERLDGCSTDSTLVRLKARPAPRGEFVGWRDDLPDLLEQINARPLAEPSEIFRNPQSHWQSQSAYDLNDEYYVVHTEGYKYSKSNHAVKTGFGLAERSEVIDKACCTLLEEILEPSLPLKPDSLSINKKDWPLTLKSFSDLAQRPSMIDKVKAEKLGLSQADREHRRQEEHETQRKNRQQIIYEALKRATRGVPLRILILCQNEDTCKALRQQIREGLLLNDDDALPPKVFVEEHVISDDELLQPLEPGSLDPNTFLKKRSEWPSNFRSDWEKRMKQSHYKKMDKWRKFLQKTFLKVESEHKLHQTVALVELKEYKSGFSFHESQNIKGAVREACVREKILSQVIYPIKLEEIEQPSEVNLTRRDKGRIQNAVLDITTRQIGLIYGSVPDVYEAIGIAESTAKKLDVVAFCLKRTQSKWTYYGLAVRLRANGEIDVRLPSTDSWIPYHEAGWQIGQLFSEARKNQPEENINLSVSELTDFVEDTLTNHLTAPSVALIRAEVWRNSGRNGGWPQLRVTDLADKLNILEFGSSQSGFTCYDRKNPQLNDLLAVIRLRDREEAPQYVTNRQTWQSDDLTRDLKDLSGFVEFTEKNIFHYFSVGRLPTTVKSSQKRRTKEDPYKSEEGGGIAFKHQQMIEMVPFFVHPDFQNESGLKALCRIPHYLRSSPAWGVGNLVLPYPVHLGLKLIEDHLCILSSHSG